MFIINMFHCNYDLLHLITAKHLHNLWRRHEEGHILGVHGTSCWETLYRQVPLQPEHLSESISQVQVIFLGYRTQMRTPPSSEDLPAAKEQSISH